MDNWNSVSDILDFAIKEEEGAAEFYKNLAGKMVQPAMKTVFEDFAKEEIGHKEKLLNIKSHGSFTPAKGKVGDLQLADYLVEVKPTNDMGYQQALIIAMKKEKAAFKLYSDMAATATNPAIKDLFLMLAQEEAKHKLRFEIEYDDMFTEN